MNFFLYIGLIALMSACSPPSSSKDKETPLTTSPEEKNLPLIYLAAKKGNLSKVASLIDSGIPVDTINEDQQTALHAASGHGHVEVLQFLFKTWC